MIKFRSSALAVLFGGLSLTACQPKTVAANPPPPQNAAPPAAQVATAPAKTVTMVCRNSQTGASAECGTPNAVMVGVKEK